MEVGDALPEAEVEKASTLAHARVIEEIQSRVLKMVDVKGHLFGSEPSKDRDVSLGMRTRINIKKRESALQDAEVAQKVARSIQLSRDHQLMDSLSMGELLDQAMVNSIRVSFHNFKLVYR